MSSRPETCPWQDRRRAGTALHRRQPAGRARTPVRPGAVRPGPSMDAQASPSRDRHAEQDEHPRCDRRTRGATRFPARPGLAALRPSAWHVGERVAHSPPKGRSGPIPPRTSPPHWRPARRRAPSSTPSPSSTGGPTCAGSMPPKAGPRYGRSGSPRWPPCWRRASSSAQGPERRQSMGPRSAAPGRQPLTGCLSGTFEAPHTLWSCGDGVGPTPGGPMTAGAAIPLPGADSYRAAGLGVSSGTG